MNNQYYVVITGNKPAGPYARDVIVQMIKDGIVNADTLLWNPETQSYIRIQTSPVFCDLPYSQSQVVPVPTPGYGTTTVTQKSEQKSGIRGESVVGLVLAVLGLICLLIIHVLPFEIDIGNTPWALNTSIEHDLNMYKLWYVGLVVGCAFVVFGLVLVVPGFVKNRSDGIAVIGLTFCIISIIAAGYSFTKLQDINNSYGTLKLIKEESPSTYNRKKDYDEYLEESRRLKEHEDAINDITAEIDAILS